LLCVLALPRFSSASANDPSIVDLGYAQYQGIISSADNQTQFLGMRYAAPPIGDFRFRAPAPPVNVSGQGVQQASAEGPRCLQTSNGRAPSSPFPLNSTTWNKRSGAAADSEDCLYLNVYVPGTVDPNKKLPVAFWIHGGGYVSVDSSTPGQDVVRDSNNQVIVVLAFYRLGVFGFLAGQEVKNNGDLNAGLLDQTFALEWVQEHISLFGGDPQRVTIWGESAGAGSVLQHVIANGGNTEPPLFANAMTDSTFLPLQYPFDHPVPEAIFANTTARTNCSGSNDVMSCLRNVSTSDLQAVNVALSELAFAQIFYWVPVIDGSFITDSPTAVLTSGKVNGNIYRGNTNTFEGFVFVDNTTTSSLEFYVSNAFSTLNNTQVAAVVDAYSKIPGITTSFNQAVAIQGESIFICPTYLMLNTFGTKGYKSEFAVPPGFHGQDVAYIFTSIGSSPESLVKSYSQSFLDLIIFDDPNHKFDQANLSPQFSPWINGHNEVQYNVSADGQTAVLQTIQTDEGLLSRCDLWRSLAPFSGQ